MEADPYKEFNHALKFFMRELMKVFPDVGDLKMLFSLYKMMKTISRKKPQRYFQDLLDGHQSELLSKNVDYFLSIQPADATLRKIMGPLKHAYASIDDENKEVIWQHMIALYFLSCKCEQKIEKKLSQDSIKKDDSRLQIKNSGSLGEVKAEGSV